MAVCGGIAGCCCRCCWNDEWCVCTVVRLLLFFSGCFYTRAILTHGMLCQIKNNNSTKRNVEKARHGGGSVETWGHDTYVSHVPPNEKGMLCIIYTGCLSLIIMYTYNSLYLVRIRFDVFSAVLPCTFLNAHL